MVSFLCAVRRLVLVLALAALAGGCSTVQFAYSAGPTALAFMADSYLDLDSAQSALLKERILAVREWNRTNHLVEYSQFLARVRDRMAGTVSAEDARWAYDEARARWRVLGGRVADEIADMAPQLNADNMKALAHKYVRTNEEFTRERINVPLAKQLENRFERTLEQAERWYGSFDDAQRTRIRALTDALPSNPSLILEDRKRRQAEFLAVLSAVVEKRIGRDAARTRLATLITDWEVGRSPAYQAFATPYMAQSFQMAAQIANLATPEQRQTAQRRVQRWVDDIAALGSRKEP